MQTVSQLFNDLWAGEHRVESKIVIEGTEYLDDSIVSLDISHSLFSDNKPQAGCVVCGMANISIIAEGLEIPRRASVKPYIRLCNEDGSVASEWIQKGEFFTDKRHTDDNGILSFTAYDALMKSERMMYTTTGQQDYFPMIDTQMVSNIASDIGVEVDPRTLMLMDKGYQIQYPGFGDGGYTEREILSFIGAMYAGNWCISDTGKLRLIPLMISKGGETYYLVTENGEPIVFGNDRIIWRGLNG